MFAYLLMPAIAFATHSLIAQHADLSFGHAQVEQVICDRPEMGLVINHEPALRALLEFCFAGELAGQRIYWDCREPADGQPAGHFPPHRDYPAFVRVSNRSTSSAIDKCMMLVIELQHSRFDRNYLALNMMAVEKQISRNDFARNCVRLEFQAAENAIEFFRKHPLADASSKSDPYYTSLLAFSGDFSDYLRRMDNLDDTTYNPQRYFLQVYDELSAPTGSAESSSEVFKGDEKRLKELGAELFK